MPRKMILLKPSDGETFEIEESVALQSQTLKNIIDDNCGHDSIPLPNVTSHILVRVIEYLKRHNPEPSSSSSSGEGEKKEDIISFDSEFVKVDKGTLFDLIMAANYLDIKSLLNLTCQTVAHIIKDKTVEEIRNLLNIQNDFTPEEEAQIRLENAWAFD